MEALNMDWLTFSTHDLAIRRFCPARAEEEKGGEFWDDIFNDVDLSSPAETIASANCLDSSEIDDFVDSFINMENCVSADDQASPMEDSGESNPRGDSQSEAFEIEAFEAAPSVEEVSHGVDQGLHLVHMLLACAEAVGCRDTNLAESILGRIWGSVSPYGDSLQRVSYCFATGLKSRLSLLQNVNTNGTLINEGSSSSESSLATREERFDAFRALHQATPFIAFGFMVANEAICQSATGKDYLHILDLEMENVLQWPSLIRNLASRPEGPPKSLRITATVSDPTLLPDLESKTRLLAQEATALGLNLEFNLIPEAVTPSILTKSAINLHEDEALFVNGLFRFHRFVKESRGSLKAILLALKRLSPTLLTLVEQDANHNGPFFLGRFLESLHYYSAVFDSLEASLGRESPQRAKIEGMHFGEEIRNIVACEGTCRVERHERAEQWRRQMGRAGFQAMGLKCVSQVRMMMSVYGCHGYTLGTDKGCLLLGWKGRSILMASAWQLHNNVVSS